MMPRRGSSGIQALVLVAVLLLFIYGYYSFNELKNTLKKSEETAKRVKLQEENLSAQLQAISEQKNQLEESIKHDKENFQKEKDGFVHSKTDMELKFKAEKAKLEESLSSLSDELQKIKEGYEALKEQQKKHDELDNEHASERAKLTAENKRLKQETINEVAVLKNQIADLKRQNDVLKEQMRKTGKTAGEQKNEVNKGEGNVLSNNDRQPRVREDNNRIQRQNQDVKQIGEANNQEVQMQINGPLDRKQAYFEPREAKPDHPVGARPVPVVPVGDVNDQVPHADQVIPPHLEDADNHNKGDSPDAAVGDDEEKPHQIKRGVMARPNSNLFDRHLNPVQNQDSELRRMERLEQQRLNAIGLAADAARARPRRNDLPHVADHQIEKPQQARENRPNNNMEEDQLQGPAMHNEQNGNDRDDAADADEDEDYHYEDKDNKHKAPEKDAADGPHAAPVDEDDDNKDGGL